MRSRRLLTVWLAITCILFLYAQLTAECRLLMMIAHNDNGKITSAPEYEEAFNLLKRQGQNTYMADGWGITYFEKGQSATGMGRIWEDPEDENNFYWSNRFASWKRVWEDTTNYNYTWRYLRDNVDTKILLAHVRQATMGTGGIPNPHPFVFNNDGFSYTFAHNGGAGGIALDFMRQLIAQKVEDNVWDYERWVEYIEHEVDSGVYFGFVMAFIKEHNWDVLRGLRAALSHPYANAQGWSGKNFIFSDGFDVYAYRAVGNPNQASSYRLEYSILDQGTDTETVLIMTILPPGNKTVIDVNELVYFPQNGYPVHFKDINQPLVKWEKNIYPPFVHSPLFWTWTSFPVLDPFLGEGEAGSIATLTQNYEPNGSGNGFGTAVYVTDQFGNFLVREDANYPWDYGDNPLLYFNHTSGYKIRHNNLTDSTGAIITGEICSPNRLVTLLPNQDNWVGYWLLNSQNIVQALGEYLPYISSVASRNWYYSTIRSSSCPTFTMEFGQMYKIRLYSDVTEPIEFGWKNSRRPTRGRSIEETGFFRYEHQSDYQVIDIESIENDEGILEIGVFAGRDCIGAARMKEYPLQILVYPQQFEGQEIEFRFYYGSSKIITSEHTVMLYDLEGDDYVPHDLIAGEIDYSLIKLISNIDTGDDTPELKRLTAYAYPNPFNDKTTISLELPEASRIDIQIFNTKGQLVRTLYTGEQNIGTAHYYWDGKTNDSQPVTTGVYFYQIKSDLNYYQGKLLLLR